jgi:hypothetical protein
VQLFAGRLDEVRIYSMALRASQIQANMATPIGPQRRSGIELVDRAIPVTPPCLVDNQTEISSRIAVRVAQC